MRKQALSSCSSDVVWITDPALKKGDALEKAWFVEWKELSILDGFAVQEHRD